MGTMSIKKTPEGKAKISVNIPEQFLFQLDIERKNTNQDRSNWITIAIMEKLSLIKKEKNVMTKE